MAHSFYFTLTFPLPPFFLTSLPTHFLSLPSPSLPFPSPPLLSAPPSLSSSSPQATKEHTKLTLAGRQKLNEQTKKFMKTE